MRDDRYNRREFMGLVAGGVAGVLTRPTFGNTGALFAARTSQSADADLVVFNARVYTIDPAVPRAQSFAIHAGRFIAVGSTADIKGLIGKRTQTFDAEQMTIVPGFIDCHNHAGGTTLLYEVLVGNPFEVEFVTIASIVEKLRAKARETPAGTWVEGYFHDDTKLKDKRLLTARDLDQVSPSIPSWSTTAAGIHRSTTTRPSSLRASRRTRRTRRAERSIATPAVRSTAG